MHGLRASFARVQQWSSGFLMLNTISKRELQTVVACLRAGYISHNSGLIQIFICCMHGLRASFACVHRRFSSLIKFNIIFNQELQTFIEGPSACMRTGYIHVFLIDSNTYVQYEGSPGVVRLRLTVVF